MASPTTRPQRTARPDRSRTRGRSAWPLRALAAVAAGLALYAGSPPRELWWLAPIAFALFAAVIRHRSARAGFGYGLLFGFSFLMPLLGWLQDFLGADFGPWPWLGVAAVEALFVGLAGAGMARVSKLPGGPVWMAAVFVAFEVLRSSVPFGGFPWGRLAFTQDTGLLLPLAALGGSALVSFAVALIGCGLAELGLRLRARSNWAAPLAAVLVPVIGGVVMSPFIGTDADAGTARVAIVQGNAPNIGLGLLYEDGTLKANHIAAAKKLVADVQSGRVPQPDFVVLPEQVGSWGPARTDPELSAIAAQLGVPLVVGGLGKDADGSLRNQIVQWDPATGPGDRYVKQHLVPFAETIPMRSLASQVSPFVDRFPHDMVADDEPGLLNVGGIQVGVGICYDVAYDDVYTGAVQQGATVLALPTNNAWYGFSEMSYQQLAMARLRAVEHGRAVVVASTSGVSAVVQPDGSVSEQTEQFTAQNLIAEVPLRSPLTLATQLGSATTWALVALAAGAVVATWWRPRRG